MILFGPFLIWALGGGSAPLPFTAELSALSAMVLPQQPARPQAPPEARLDEVERWIKDATTKTTMFVGTTNDSVVNHRTRIEQLEAKIKELESRPAAGSSDPDAVVTAIERLQETVANPAASQADYADAGLGVLLSVLGVSGLFMVRGLRGHLRDVLLQALATPPPGSSRRPGGSLPGNPIAGDGP